MNSTAKTAGQSAKNLAQKIARQIAEEPIEILKDAGNQIIGAEQGNLQENSSQNQNPENQAKIIRHQNELQDRAKSGRRMEALNRELSDIHKQDLFKDLQAKISQGDEIPVADYSELSMEQQQVLIAQMEAVKYQKQQAAYNQSQGGTLSIISKPSRKMGAGQRGQKAEAEKQTTRVEKPVPPSG